MIIESKISWTTSQLTEAFNEKLIGVDNPRQRGLCWKPEQQGLLIRSLILGYPVPPIYTVKEGNTFDTIDGKQRITTVTGYINNQYEIHKNVPPIKLPTGEVCEIAGKKFNELPENIQNKITRRSLDINYLDNFTDESEIDTIFCLLNNGTTMSKVFLTCAKTKCIEKVNLASEHELFTSSLSEKLLEKYDNKDAVIKSYLSVFRERPSFKVADIQNEMENADILDDEILVLWEYYNNLFEVFKYINENYASLAKKLVNKIAKPNHFAALIYVIHNSKHDFSNVKPFAEWVISFFNTESTKISIDETYNKSTKGLTSENVQKRHNILIEQYTGKYSA